MPTGTTISALTSSWTEDVADPRRSIRAHAGRGFLRRCHERDQEIRGFIDRYVLHVYPLVLGRGKRLFPEGKQLKLTLDHSEALPTGVVFQQYTPVR
jgi:hypothetical protein